MGTRKKYTGHPPAAVPHDTGLHVPPHVLRFLNSLPVVGEPVEWMLQFREALGKLLGDVDRVAVRVNMDRPFKKVGSKAAWSMSLNQGVYIENGVKKIFLPKAEFTRGEDCAIDAGIFSKFLDDMRRLNYPLHEYQSPQCYDYYWPGELMLGGIMLFRRRGASPISIQTQHIVESLKPFFIFAFTSLKARYHYCHPGPAIFNWSILQLYIELKLRDREFEILILRLNGLTFKEIAAQLFISHATVRKHLQSLLRKGKARNAIELFTRRFLGGAEDMLAAGKDAIPERIMEIREEHEDLYLW